MDCPKKTAEHLAEFIALNWHYCPISETHNVPGCTCWGSENCSQCLLENADHIKVSN